MIVVRSTRAVTTALAISPKIVVSTLCHHDMSCDLEISQKSRGGPKIYFFTVIFSYLHYNIIQLGYEAISGRRLENFLLEF